MIPIALIVAIASQKYLKQLNKVISILEFIASYIYNIIIIIAIAIYNTSSYIS